MIKTIISYLTIIIILSSCCETKNKAKKSEKDPKFKESLTPLSNYLKLYLPSFSVTDSCQIRSVNSTIYYVKEIGTSDKTDYFIIRDNSSKQLFKIIHSYWPIFNGILPQEVQLKVLENDPEGQILEPVNYIFLGLESFLNECVALEKQELNPYIVDTIIRFYDKELIRLTLPAQIDTLLNRCEPKEKENKAEFKKYIEQKRLILKKKIDRKNVLLYSYPSFRENNSFIYFFEINPGITDYSRYPDVDAEKFNNDKIFLVREVNGNNYNLVFMLIN